MYRLLALVAICATSVLDSMIILSIQVLLSFEEEFLYILMLVLNFHSFHLVFVPIQSLVFELFPL